MSAHNFLNIFCEADLQSCFLLRVSLGKKHIYLSKCLSDALWSYADLSCAQLRCFKAKSTLCFLLWYPEGIHYCLSSMNFTMSPTVLMFST